MNKSKISSAFFVVAMFFGQAYAFDIKDSYSGPLYRSMIGESVTLNSDGSKVVSSGDEILMSCTPRGKNKNTFNNEYDCSINFQSLTGPKANLVYRAIHGQDVVLRSEIASAETCSEDHCVKVWELNCASQISCSIENYHSGWNE